MPAGFLCARQLLSAMMNLQRSDQVSGKTTFLLAGLNCGRSKPRAATEKGTKVRASRAHGLACERGMAPLAYLLLTV